MQVVTLHLCHTNFFCPVTGRELYVNIEDRPGSMLASWLDIMLDEPEITDPELAEVWEKYAEGKDELDVSDFLRLVDRTNWVGFEVHSGGVGCGPQSSSCWFVIDMDYVE
jgi:hypothetical protein